MWLRERASESKTYYKVDIVSNTRDTRPVLAHTHTFYTFYTPLPLSIPIPIPIRVAIIAFELSAPWWAAAAAAAAARCRVVKPETPQALAVLSSSCSSFLSSSSCYISFFWQCAPSQSFRVCLTRPGVDCYNNIAHSADFAPLTRRKRRCQCWQLHFFTAKFGYFFILATITLVNLKKSSSYPKYLNKTLG